MKRLEAVIATTHVDSQGEKFTREALDSLIESISNSYIPVGIEHDPRIPPQGRISSGFIRERPDGEFEAVAIIELFEEYEPVILPDDPREIVMKRHKNTGWVISYDWTRRSFDEDLADIIAIADIFATKPVYNVKKSADPISLLTIEGSVAPIIIGGSVIVGHILGGFFKEVGIDAWKALKTRLNSLFSRSKKRNGEHLLSFNILSEVEGAEIEVQIILTNPTPEDIEWLLENGLDIIEKVLPTYLSDVADLRRFVFEAKNNGVELKFAVRKDCKAVAPTISVAEILRNNPRKL